MLLAISVLIPLGLTAAPSAVDEGIQKKMFRSGSGSYDLEPLVREPEHR